MRTQASKSGQTVIKIRDKREVLLCSQGVVTVEVSGSLQEVLLFLDALILWNMMAYDGLK